MHPFRQSTPARRSLRSECKHYGAYKMTLKEDFLGRCGYCNDSDLYRVRSYAVDHFVPRNPVNFTHSIPDNYYYNLVYSCSYCNSEKSNKWPTLDSSRSNDGQSGFIDPTLKDYGELFYRSKQGVICAQDSASPLAAYMIKHLALWLPVHALLWKLERVNVLSDAIERKISETVDVAKKKELEVLHYEIVKLQRDIFREIFLTNE